MRSGEQRPDERAGDRSATGAAESTPRRRDADARRRALVEATIRVIAAHGMGAATVGRISAEAGVSRGLISHYFAGKDDLLRATYRRLADELAAETARIASARGETAQAKLRAAVEAAFRSPVFAADKITVWLAFWAEARHRPSLGALNRELYRGYRATITRLMAEAARERGAALDAHRAAVALTALIDGLWLEWTLDREAFSPAEAMGASLDFLERLFAAPHPQPPYPRKDETPHVP